MFKLFIKIFFFKVTSLLFLFKKLFNTSIVQRGRIKYFKSTLQIHKNGLLDIDDNVMLINSSVVVGNGSKLLVGPDCVLKNVIINVGENSIVELGRGVVIRSITSKSDINVHNGTLLLEDFVILNSVSISLRFNSKLRIGHRTGIGFNSEIICDESVDIGRYCLISNNVDIYDTNSHSVNYIDRRDRIEKGYPVGCDEIVKPKTSPIKIGDDVWIGKKSVVLKGVTIGSRSIVGIGSKVTADTYPDDSIIVNDKTRFFPLNK